MFHETCQNQEFFDMAVWSVNRPHFFKIVLYVSESLQNFTEKQFAFRLWTQNKLWLLWNDYRLAQSHANYVYDNAKMDYNSYLSETLSSTNEPHRCKSALKSFLFEAQWVISRERRLIFYLCHLTLKRMARYLLYLPFVILNLFWTLLGFDLRSFFSTLIDQSGDVNHILHLKYVGVLRILKEFVITRKQRIAVVDFYSSVTQVRFGDSTSSVLEQLLFIIFTDNMWSGLENNMIVYVDDCTSYTTIKSPVDRFVITEFLNLDLGIYLNHSKSTSIVFDLSKTLNLPNPDLVIYGH